MSYRTLFITLLSLGGLALTLLSDPNPRPRWAAFTASLTLVSATVLLDRQKQAAPGSTGGDLGGWSDL